MNKFIIWLFPLLIIGTAGFAQNTQGGANDRERLSIGVMKPDNIGELPSNAVNMLSNRISKALSLNGMSAADESGVINIKTFISTLNKEVTATAPPMITTKLEVSLKLVDKFEGNSYNEVIYQFRGVGESEEEAYAQAFRRFNPRDRKMRAFIEKGKEHVIAYYNTHCDLVMSKANGLISANKYQEAYDLLMGVPSVSRECYDQAMMKIDEFGDKLPDDPVPSGEDGEGDDEAQGEGIDRIELMNGLVVKYKEGKYYGEKLALTFTVSNPAGEERMFKIDGGKSSLINKQGETIGVERMKIANKNSQWNNLDYSILPGTPVELLVVFPKEDDIRQISLHINKNNHAMDHLPIKK